MSLRTIVGRADRAYDWNIDIVLTIGHDFEVNVFKQYDGTDLFWGEKQQLVLRRNHDVEGVHDHMNEANYEAKCSSLDEVIGLIEHSRVACMGAQSAMGLRQRNSKAHTSKNARA